MSNYHSYHCLDCNESCKPSNLNHGEDQMCAVLRYKKEVAALKPLGNEVWNLELVIGYGHNAPVEFLAAHLEHRVVVLSEYRDYYIDPEGTRHEEKVPY